MVAGKGQRQGADRAPFDLQGQTSHGPVTAPGVDAAMVRVPRDPLLPGGQQDWLAGADHLGHQRRTVQRQSLCPLRDLGCIPQHGDVAQLARAVVDQEDIAGVGAERGHRALDDRRADALRIERGREGGGQLLQLSGALFMVRSVGSLLRGDVPRNDGQPRLGGEDVDLQPDSVAGRVEDVVLDVEGDPFGHRAAEIL